MSNSRKRHPVTPMTTSRSDKAYKQAEHRRERSAVKKALAHGKELPSPELFGDEWHSHKDGKRYWSRKDEQPWVRRK